MLHVTCLYNGQSTNFEQKQEFFENFKLFKAYIALLKYVFIFSIDKKTCPTLQVRIYWDYLDLLL
jgi:hypothetical protein